RKIRRYWLPKCSCRSRPSSSKPLRVAWIPGFVVFRKVKLEGGLRNPCSRQSGAWAMLHCYMRIEFLKMQGLGNDFLVFDAPAAADIHLDSSRLRALADRHTGIGFDQALLLENPRNAGSRVFYRIFNSDGTEVEQCGNGARCIAALLYSRAPQLGRQLLMGSPGGTVRAQVREDGLVSVDMGVPNFDPSALPMVAPGGGALAEASAYS